MRAKGVALTMQSSFVTLLRALVMLGCLAVIPLIAVFGTALPAKVVEFLDSHLAAKAESAEQPLAAAPPFTLRAGPSPTESLRPSVANELPASPRLELEPPDEPELRITPASFCPAEPSLQPPPSMQGVDLVPVVRDRSAAVPTSHRCEGVTVGRGPEADSPVESDEPIKVIEKRLQELGATYYRLECWGENRDVYHFFCKMPIGGNPNFTRYFDDTQTRPGQAMRNVLEQIETWRSGQ
jgi:hypothetical protein